MRIELKTKDEELVELVGIKGGEVFKARNKDEYWMKVDASDYDYEDEELNAVNIETGEVMFFAESKNVKKVDVKVTVYDKEQ